MMKSPFTTQLSPIAVTEGLGGEWPKSAIRCLEYQYVNTATHDRHPVIREYFDSLAAFEFAIATHKRWIKEDENSVCAWYNAWASDETGPILLARSGM